MGYEVTMHIGIISHAVDDYEKGAWLYPIAVLEMTKIYDSKLSNLAGVPGNGEKVYFYGTDGNTSITEDCYGKRLRAIDPQVVLKALTYDVKHGQHRRFTIAKALLESIIEEFQGAEIAIVLYGH